MMLALDPSSEADAESLVARLSTFEGTRRKPRWAWGLVIVGLIVAAAAAYHGSGAYATVHAIDQRSDVSTPNPGALFDLIATTGPRVGSTVDNASRGVYGKALEQYVVDGTLAGLGIMLVLGGLYARLIR